MMSFIIGRRLVFEKLAAPNLRTNRYTYSLDLIRLQVIMFSTYGSHSNSYLLNALYLHTFSNQHKDNMF
jgi:hypothetical protein